MTKYLIKGPTNLRNEIVSNIYDSIKGLLRSYLIFVKPFIKYFVIFIKYFLNQGLGFKYFDNNFSNKLKLTPIR